MTTISNRIAQWRMRFGEGSRFEYPCDFGLRNLPPNAQAQRAEPPIGTLSKRRAQPPSVRGIRRIAGQAVPADMLCVRSRLTGKPLRFKGFLPDFIRMAAIDDELLISGCDAGVSRSSSAAGGLLNSKLPETDHGLSTAGESGSAIPSALGDTRRNATKATTMPAAVAPRSWMS